ncbi:RNA polymerase sigma factor (sigma-70 family) [Actinoalloteichus hoggarensis]|uniref:RNA polymerase sigma factor n=1 Tax=Actinoalloteichus hoggarensis TaxID=1470176 RepID=A0A221W944_9PSEU|nr:sigma-70 family RNA polymerase sigma factor [Actinoalloteichus hoggarensis]ASO22542.1 RNA polymerase sigma factor [Actinoalloteichus hoggarensis]MBB5923034.1 RNA polymerase sigma factor (sigma-70 family) [Actinoalloteichus hoggarensis]
MAIVSSDLPEPTDQELIEAVRAGSVEAYGSLYERHVSAAYNLARQLARSPAERDDLVSDAFSKVLDRLRAGNGPDIAFRAYLLTALRHAAYDRTRKERRVEVSEDVAAVPGVDVSVPFHDRPIAELERSLAARAFARLPERWRTVLWHMEVEGQSASTVAPLLGLTPNAVSALAYRAREGLRQSYLQVHLAETQTERCRAAVERLGSWTRGGLSRRETTQVEAHLDDCARCRALSVELIDLNGTLREVGVLVLGAGAGGYLAAVSAGTVGGAGAAVTGTISASAVTGAVTAAPRQWLTAAASSVALAAAVVAALLAEPAPRPVAQPSPPAVEQQAPPVPPPPEMPAPPVPAPDAPPAPPAESSPPEDPAAEDPPADEPGEPALDIATPTDPLVLLAGGAAGALPVTVTNTGSATSPVVVASLDLPPGISAWLVESEVPPQTTARPVALSTAAASARAASPVVTTDDHTTAAAVLSAVATSATSGPPTMLAEPLDGASGSAITTAAVATTTAQPGAGSTPQGINCGSGVGSIRCATARGLNPGESVVFEFALQASAEARSGRVTGTVGAGQAARIELSAVSVEVRQPVDALDLTAEVGQRLDGDLPWIGRVVVRLTNTGTTTGPAQVDVTAPWWFVPRGLSPECAAAGPSATPDTPRYLGDRRITCRAPGQLAPGEEFHLELEFARASLVDGTVEVEGRLGDARRRVDAPIASPSLRATLDRLPEALEIGGAPDTLTYSVRNDGRGGSASIEMTVRLPTGVHAEGIAGHDCRSEANEIHCRSEAGLPPGAVLSFDFSVRAVAPAASGPIGGSVHAGLGTRLPLPAGRITVVEPPKIDAVAVQASTRGSWAVPTSPHAPHWTYYTNIRIKAVNTGETENPVTVTLGLPPEVGTHSWHGPPPHADDVSAHTAHLLRCRAPGEPVELLSPTLRPGQAHEFTVRLCTTGGATPPAASEVAVHAMLGVSEQDSSIRVPWRLWWPWRTLEPAGPRHSPESAEPTTEPHSADPVGPTTPAAPGGPVEPGASTKPGGPTESGESPPTEQAGPDPQGEQAPPSPSPVPTPGASPTPTEPTGPAGPSGPEGPPDQAQESDDRVPRVPDAGPHAERDAATRVLRTRSAEPRPSKHMSGHPPAAGVEGLIPTAPARHE